MESSDPRSPAEMDENLDAFSKELENRSRLAPSADSFVQSVREKVAKGDSHLAKRKIKKLISTLEERSSDLPSRVRFRDVGTVQHIGNGIATVSGLPNVSIDEIVTFPTGVEGMALNLEQKRVDLIMLGTEKGIRGGDLVQATGKRLSIPVGGAFLGRIVDPLGTPLDNDTPIEISEYRYLSRVAPGVINRSPVNESLFTGTKLIDTLFPIGRGQRELILGDRQTGKTTLAIDAILPKELKAGTESPSSIVENGESFSEVLQRSLKEVNGLQQDAEKAAVDIATGQVKDLHQAAIAIGKAETSMKLMLEVRNKAVSAYKELLQTQV